MVERDGLPEAARVGMRATGVGRLLELRAGASLTSSHVRVAAGALGALGVSERTVWRWLAEPLSADGVVRPPGVRGAGEDRFVVTGGVRALLALWGGNVAAVQRDLASRAAGQSPAGVVPSLTTLRRVLRRDLTAGECAGLRVGSGPRGSAMCSWPGRGGGVTRCGRLITSRRRSGSMSRVSHAGRGSPGSRTAC